MPSTRQDPGIRLAASLSPVVRTRLLQMAPPGLSREALLEAYVDDDRDICSIARANGCRATTVLFHLALNGIPLRGSAPPTG